MDQTPASNEPTSPDRNHRRSPPPVDTVVVEDPTATEIARRTCPVCLRVFDSAKAMWGHSWVHRERNQIHAMAPPPGGSGGLALALGPTNDSVAAGGSIGWQPWKIDSKAEKDRTCPRCSRIFGSPKAMYGHLHVHHERSTPRTRAKGESSSSQIPIQLVVEPERPTVEDEKNDSPISIDLNRPVCMEDEEICDDEESSPLFDLNRSPPSS